MGTVELLGIISHPWGRDKAEDVTDKSRHCGFRHRTA